MSAGGRWWAGGPPKAVTPFRSERTYPVAVAPPLVWDALASVDRYQEWWPWLRRFDAVALAPGERWDCVIRPPLPYLLHFAVHLREVAPPRSVTAELTGDIAGSAHLVLEAAGEGCELRLCSELRPVNRALAWLTLLARPVARAAHTSVLDTGAAQFSERALNRL